MTLTIRWTTPALIACLCVASGCHVSRPAETRLSPSDFAGSATAAAAPQPSSQANSAGSDAPSDTTEPTTAGTTATSANNRSDGERQVIVDAMVGQVNGKPIYASEIFRVIGEETLTRLGTQKPRLQFQADVTELIVNELRSRVTNAVILAEAERGLTEQQKMGLLGYVKEQRQKILSRYGGVLALAEQGILRDTGRTLDEELEVRRQRLLTEMYLREKLYPKIVVTRREVERYYDDHHAQFNPSPSVTVRLILVQTEAKAEAVDEALAKGADFASVASQYSTFRAAEGGLLPTFQLTGKLEDFSSLSFPELNVAVRDLNEGEHSQRVKLSRGYGWVKLEKLEGGEARTLQEAFLEIEARLKSQKFNALSRKYLDQLMRDGNYTPIEQMSRALIEVAMTRYARPQ